VLAFTRAAYDDVVAASTAAGDEEACGVLAGEYGEATSRAAAAVPVENAADAPRTRYAIDPAELYAVVERVEERGRDVVGFYHSHPRGPPRPSETDAARATWRGYSHAICALDGAPYVGSWRWTGESFEREAVALVGADGPG
jgi:proteasome lid subunit RPN8/RPN11